MNNLEYALSTYVLNYGRINKDAIIQIIEKQVQDRKYAESLYNLCQQEISILRNDMLLFQYGKKNKQEAIDSLRLRLNQPVTDKIIEQAVQLADWIVAKS